MNMVSRGQRCGNIEDNLVGRRSIYIFQHPPSPGVRSS